MMVSRSETRRWKEQPERLPGKGNKRIVVARNSK